MQKEYYSITNKLYSLKDANHYDYAVMSAVATFNYPFVTDSEDEKVTEIKVQPFTITDIASRLKLSNTKNVKVNNDKIEQSLKKLMKAEVLKVVEVVKSEGKENTFILKQNVDLSGQFTGFASIVADEFFNITLKIEKDSDRIKALACYVSIVQRIFKTAKRTKQANFNWENTLTYFVNWESQENIGGKYGMSRKAVAKSIELLVEVEAIAIKVVKQKNGGKEVKSIYSKFSDRDELNDYVKLMIEQGEYKKEIVKTAKVAKAKTTKATAKVEKVIKVEEIAEAKAKTTKTKAKTKVAKADETKTNKKELLSSLMLKNDTQKIENDDYRKAIELAIKKSSGENEQELIRIASFRAKESDNKNIDSMSEEMNDLFSFN